MNAPRALPAPDREPVAVRLSEVLGALGTALDMTEGQPPGHCVRCCWIGVNVGRELGLDDTILADLFYVLLLKDVGCSSNAARICQLYLTEDLAFKRDFKEIGDGLPHVLRFVLTHTGLRGSLSERFKTIIEVMRNGGEIARELIETRCRQGAQIADRLRFSGDVANAIRCLDEHWNGRGRPDRLAGQAIPLASRIALLAQVVDVFHTSSGRAAACREVRRRTGTWFDPAVAAAFDRVAAADSFWSGLDAPDLKDAVFALEPAPLVRHADDDYLDDIAAAFAQVIDSKSPFTRGHSDRVAIYAELIATELDLEPNRRRWLARAALLHDIGKLGISNAILDKPGRLDPLEFESIRAHPIHSEAILERIAVFCGIARIGGAHHERLDGEGYPRGLKGPDIDLDTRIVTCADVFDALTSDRPYRVALPQNHALDIMRAEIGTAFDHTCFAALERALATTAAAAT